MYTDKGYLGEEDSGPARMRGQVDNVEVVQYYKQVADEGDVKACMNLAKMYLSGSRVLSPDMGTAAYYFQLAADRGSSTALGQLGYLIARGLGGDVGKKYTPEQVYTMLQTSANRGDSSGQMGLGYCHMHGIGTTKRTSKAYEIFSKLSPKHADAAFYLGEILMGTGAVPFPTNAVNENRENQFRTRTPTPTVDGHDHTEDDINVIQREAMQSLEKQINDDTIALEHMHHRRRQMQDRLDAMVQQDQPHEMVNEHVSLSLDFRGVREF